MRFARRCAGRWPIATEALQRIAALYRIETDIRGRGPDERRAVRQERSGPLIVALQAWLRDRLALISQKSKLAEIIRYALSHGDGLTRFLDDGRIEIDSNIVERSIRPIATGLSLCTSFSSVWKHWKRLRRFGATRAPFPGDGRDDGLRMQVA
jgi:transposase